MTDNEKLKLARWQGWCYIKPIWVNLKHTDMRSNTPDYLNDDSVAMSLLDTLVEKGFIWSLYGRQAGCLCKVYKMPDAEAVSIQEGSTRREAVVAACLELIGKEDV